jgi:polysaccharide biosynthesis protein PslG
MIRKHHPNGDLPILSSEWGWHVGQGGLRPTPTPEKQGDFLARSFLVNLSQNIPLSIWYDWKNDGRDPKEGEHNFGTVTADREPKPAYKEMQRLAAALKGKTFAKRLASPSPSQPENDWLLVFASTDGQQTLAAWTTGDLRDVVVPGWSTLHLTSTPLYVSPPKK